GTAEAEKGGRGEGKKSVLLFAGPGAVPPAGFILVSLILGTALFKDKILHSSWYKGLPNSWWGVAIRFVITNLPDYSDVRHQFVRFAAGAVDGIQGAPSHFRVTVLPRRSVLTFLRAA